MYFAQLLLSVLKRELIPVATLLNYLLRGKHAPWKLFSKCFCSSCRSEKDVQALFRCFQHCYCDWNNDIMHHVTEYCNVIGAHCTVRRDKACIRSLPDPSLSCKSGSGLRDYLTPPWSSFLYHKGSKIISNLGQTSSLILIKRAIWQFMIYIYM